MSNISWSALSARSAICPCLIVSKVVKELNGQNSHFSVTNLDIKFVGILLKVYTPGKK